MAEEPEELLPEEGIAAVWNSEEVRSPAAVELKENAGRRERRKREEYDKGNCESAVKKERHTANGHARRPQTEDRDDEVDSTARRRDSEQDQLESIDIHSQAWGVGCKRIWNIGEPAGVRRLSDNAAKIEKYSREKISPVRKGIQARERHVARADHERHKIHRETREDR